MKATMTWLKKIYVFSLRFYKTHPEAEFLNEIQTKVLRVFPLAIHSHLYSFALRFIFLQTHATSYRFYTTVLLLVHFQGERMKT